MSLSINNSVSSLVVRQLLGKSTNALSQNLQRLSSGLRINSAKDGGGDLAVAMHMTTNINGLSVAKNNAGDGLSLAQVADAALEETTNALQEIRDLALDASTGTKSAEDRTALNNEIKSLISEISRIASETSLFDQDLLNGGFETVIQVGPGAGETLAVTIAGASLEHLNLGVSGSKMNVSTAGAASATIAASRAVLAADVAMDSVAAIRASLGGVQNRFESIINILDASTLAYTDTRSRIMDVDFAEESVQLAHNNILQQAGVAMLVQANLQPEMLLSLLDTPN